MNKTVNINNNEVKTLGGIYDSKTKIYCLSSFETKDAYFEQIRCEGGEHCELVRGEINNFIKFNKNDSKTELLDKVTIGDITYKPIVNDLTKEKGILLPSNIEEYGSDDELIRDMGDFMFKYFEPPKYYESILPYLLMFYWIYDKFPFVPYLHFVGLTGTGKSTALEVFGSISYKAINSSGSITIASLFRIASLWRGTLLMDEFSLGNSTSETYSERLQILKGGVSNMPVFRIEGDKKKEIVSYQIKSPRIFSSQEVIQDAALQSRTIVVKMSKNKKVIPLYRLDSFHEQAQSIRNKLLLWRFRHLNAINLKDIEYGVKELKSFDGRVQQVLTPIYYISNKKTKEKIVEFAKQQEIDTKRERLEEIDGIIFSYLFDHLKEEVLLSNITDFVKKQREKQGYKTFYSERKLGNVIRKILGFETERTREGYVVKIDQSKIQELSIYYGLEEPCTSSQHSQSSQSVLDVDIDTIFDAKMSDFETSDGNMPKEKDVERI